MPSILAHVPAKWDPVRRKGHAPIQELTALPGQIGFPNGDREALSSMLKKKCEAAFRIARA